MNDVFLAVAVVPPLFALAGRVSSSHGRNQVPDVSVPDVWVLGVFRMVMA